MTLQGPPIGARGVPLVFTATVNAGATPPLTYTWSTNGGVARTITHRTSRLTDTAALSWTTPGTKAITVTVRNSEGQLTLRRAIALTLPPAALALLGPAEGAVRVGQTFTARVSLSETLVMPRFVLPLTYTWRATGQPPTVLPRDSLSDTVTFTWTTPGAQTVMVTATNGAGTVYDFQPVNLIAPLTGVAISAPRDGETGVPQTLVATVSPDFASLPLTFTWWMTEHAPFTRVLDDGRAFTEDPSDWLTFTWTTTGTHAITVSVTNIAGKVVSDTAAIAITLPVPPGDAYEEDNDCTQARFIPTDGTTQMHTFHVPDDEDWVAFQATAGVTYVVEARIPPTSAANVKLELFDRCD